MISYLSQTGALNATGYADRPQVAPMNLLADFGSGSMFALLGIVAVLSWSETARGGHLAHQATVLQHNGLLQAAPAPRFSRSSTDAVNEPPAATTALDDVGW